jgi:hypothetical protein
MKRIAVIVLLILASLLAIAQTDNTIYVKQFPGPDVGSKVAAAQLTCNSNAKIPCILVLDPSLAVWAQGTMPTLCGNCSLLDYRSGAPVGGGGSGTSTDSLHSGDTNAFLHEYLNGLNFNADFAAEQGGGTSASAVLGAAHIPSSAATFGVNGIAGAIDNYSTTTAGVGGYFQGIAKAAGVRVWGLNSLCDTRAGLPASCTSFEADANAQNAKDVLEGVQVGGAFNAQPGSAIGFQLLAPVGTAKAKWTAGYQVDAGSTNYAFVAGPEAASGTNSQSGLYFYQAFNSTGAVLSAWNYLDPQGNLQFFPSSATTLGGTVFNSNSPTSPTLQAVTTGAGAYVPTLVALAPHASSGAQLFLGKALSNNNAVVFQFNPVGGAGSATNTLSIGLYGSAFPASLDGSGNFQAVTLKPAAVRKSTFVCTAGGTIAVANVNESSTSDVLISLNTKGGTITAAPFMVSVTPGTGFSVQCGAGDTSTYNYDILN